jgi:hypothetical protein
MMIANIYVLGPWAKLWKPCEFQGSCVVLKHLAVDIRFNTNDLEVPSLISCSKFMMGMTSHSACAIAMYSASEVDREN